VSIKLIVTDMDGTLLNENIEITANTTAAIMRAQDAGVEIAVATGRNVDEGYSLLKAKGLTMPFIGSNGARVFDENEKLLITHAIEKADVRALIAILDNYDIHHQFFTQNGSFSTKSVDEYVKTFTAVFKSINPTMTEEELSVYLYEHSATMDLEIVDSYDFLYQDPKVQVLKSIANANADIEILDDIQKNIESNLNNIIVTSSSPHNLEINNKYANKGQALSDFAKQRGYSPDEVITIGDSLNDITMLQWATHSYAVENAHQEVKSVAKYKAPSHTQEPVARIIDKVLAGDKLTF
jgi:hypothetical protein